MHAEMLLGARCMKKTWSGNSSALDRWMAGELVVRKTSAVGWTGQSFGPGLSVSARNVGTKPLALVHPVQAPLGELILSDGAEVVGERAGIQLAKDKASEFKEPLDFFVGRERFANVVDLLPSVLKGRIGQKKYPRDGEGARGDVLQFAVRALPYAVKLCLDEHLRPFPDRPTEDSPSSVLLNPIPNQPDAFIERGTCGGVGPQIDWLRVGCYGFAEAKYPGFEFFGGSHGSWIVGENGNVVMIRKQEGK